jgi:hypothetical protein
MDKWMQTLASVRNRREKLPTNMPDAETPCRSIRAGAAPTSPTARATHHEPRPPSRRITMTVGSGAGASNSNATLQRTPADALKI